MNFLLILQSPTMILILKFAYTDTNTATSKILLWLSETVGAEISSKAWLLQLKFCCQLVLQEDSE